MEVGDYWKRPEFTYPRRVNGISSLWGRVYYVSFESSNIALKYSYVIKNYSFYKKSDDKTRRVINTGETQSTTVLTFSGMPSAIYVALEIIGPYILTVAAIASAVGLIAALSALLTWIRS